MGSCCMMKSLMWILWLAGTSVLLFFTWNKVVTTVSSLKPIKFFHALLVVATVCAFCCGHHMMGCKSKKSCCSQKSSKECGDCNKESKEERPAEVSAPEAAPVTE
ncbi:MAG: hypothetical protein KBD63_04820 [Bacteriovoracaceae bacterium]|nr:hypothetical protein [Bacteriovoracaceae bacterium]